VAVVALLHSDASSLVLDSVFGQLPLVLQQPEVEAFSLEVVAATVGDVGFVLLSWPSYL
jgi:hypothetical protein